MEAFVLKSLLEQEPDFKQAWETATDVIGFFDKGKHYDSEEFLLYRMQFLEGGHGKKLVDGNIFGHQNVGDVLSNLRGRTRLMSHTQLRDECVKFKAEIRNTWTDEERDLGMSSTPLMSFPSSID